MRHTAFIFNVAVTLGCVRGQTYYVQALAGGGGFNYTNYSCIPKPLCAAPYGSIALDGEGNVFISVPTSNVVVRLDTFGGVSLVAGNGNAGYGGDDGPAGLASLNKPTGIAIDSSGSLYIADQGNNRIRKVSNGVIRTVVGNGTSGSSGNGGAATNAELAAPSYVAVSASGDMYISDSGNFWIRKVSNGIITTVAGMNTAGYSGDGGPATSAQLNGPAGLAIDSAGNVYVADSGNNRIRMISNGLITTVAGGGTSPNNGIPAMNARLSSPMGIELDSTGNLYVADFGDYQVREISNGLISTIAVSGTNASFQPTGIAVDHAGAIYVTDFESSSLRKIVEGVIQTIGISGYGVIPVAYSGGGYGPAFSAWIGAPQALTVDASGSVYIGG